MRLTTFKSLSARQGRTARPAFSLIELLVVVGIIAILSGLVMTAFARARRAAERIDCASRLQQIGLAMQSYAMDHHGILPDPAASEMSWERSLLKYMGGGGGGANLFRCAADNELFPSVGSSYDWRDTGLASTTLAGRPMADVNRGRVVLAFEALPGWHAPKKMIAVRLDGSVETMDQEQCLSDLTTPIR
jgi:prepilin-type N-terminal cleavage/methylation domain-containing protein